MLTTGEQAADGAGRPEHPRRVDGDAFADRYRRATHPATVSSAIGAAP